MSCCSALKSIMLLRSISEILPAPAPHWVGDGFNVFPVFADKAFTAELSPFLMFDYAAPKYFEPNTGGKPRGVGSHPHRGMETVTIAFQGEVEHRDSLGNRGVIGPGDVQWMSAARGIIHSEFHGPELCKKGGLLEMAQLWVNLPAKYKMGSPRYQEILMKDIVECPLFEAGADAPSASDAGVVRVIAGDYRNGSKGPASTYSPIDVWDVRLSATSVGKTFVFEPLASSNVIIFVRSGSVSLNGGTKTLGPQDVALFKAAAGGGCEAAGAGGGSITLSSAEGGASVLYLAGTPINEPIAARGPFVMNTFDEIMQANRDYASGKFGN